MRGILDPGCAAFLRAIRLAGAVPPHALAPAQARALMRERRGATQLSSQALVAAEDRTARAGNVAVPVRVYRPAGIGTETDLPALVYYHGGGWTMGDLEVFDAMLRELCAQSQAAVVSVDYRLAPEHRFPAALDDACAALRWVQDCASDLGIDASRVAVGGDSAGANLATVVAGINVDHARPQLCFQLLIYPVTDVRGQTRSYDEPDDGHLMTAQTMRWFIDNYLDEAARHGDWRVSPLLRTSLSGLPPALVITAGFDPRRDEGRAYADRLSEAAVPTEDLCFERQFHGFFTMTRVSSEASLAISVAALALKRAFHAFNQAAS
jgi:acetyl esterase